MYNCWAAHKLKYIITCIFNICFYLQGSIIITVAVHHLCFSNATFSASVHMHFLMAVFFTQVGFVLVIKCACYPETNTNMCHVQMQCLRLMQMCQCWGFGDSESSHTVITYQRYKICCWLYGFVTNIFKSLRQYLPWVCLYLLLNANLSMMGTWIVHC